MAQERYRANARLHSCANRGKNAITIYEGLWRGNAKQIFSRHTHESFQNGIGFAMAMYYNQKDADATVSYLDGATVISGPNMYRDEAGATTIGSFVAGQNGLRASADDHLFVHEYGHYMQSQSSGALYLYKYGMPSALTETPLIRLFNPFWNPIPHITYTGDHANHWVERDASRRGFEHFGLEEDPHILRVQ